MGTASGFNTRFKWNADLETPYEILKLNTLLYFENIYSINWKYWETPTSSEVKNKTLITTTVKFNFSWRLHIKHLFDNVHISCTRQDMTRVTCIQITGADPEIYVSGGALDRRGVWGPPSLSENVKKILQILQQTFFLFFLFSFFFRGGGRRERPRLNPRLKSDIVYVQFSDQYTISRSFNFFLFCCCCNERISQIKNHNIDIVLSE